MDFFTAQDKSRRSTRVLVGLFFLATLAIVAIITGAVAIALKGQSFTGLNQSWNQFLAAEWPLLASVAGGTAGFILLASLYRIATLSQGGAQVARMLGGTAVPHDTRDPLQRRLVNVVEEMAIASGVPVPAVFVLEEEAGINAFAAGFEVDDAAVAVTRGTLEQLSRRELQGVIGHEFSHILNGDMRLNLRLMGILFGILALALTGRWMLRGGRFSTSRNRGGVSGLIAVGIALTATGYIGLFFARIIKASVSRQREYLADASAVQFTRDPESLAGALKKIGGYTGELKATETEEVAHMLFSRGARRFRGLFATHPPLEQRIRLLDPSFEEPDYPAPRGPMAEVAEASHPGAAAFVKPPASAEEALARSGNFGDDELALAEALHDRLPEELVAAARSDQSCVLLALALMTSHDPAHRNRQLAVVEQQLGAARGRRTGQLAQIVHELPTGARLPLLELCFPQLRERPLGQRRFVLDLAKRLSEVDNVVELFEYSLVRLLKAYLNLSDERSPKPGDDTTPTLLANLAGLTQKDDAAAARALQAALESLETRGKRPTPARDLAAFDRALGEAAGYDSITKRTLLHAVYRGIAADGEIDVAEAELFRTIAATLGCPIPPLRSEEKTRRQA